MSGISPRVIAPCVLVAFLATTSLYADSKKLTNDQRIELLRGLVSEYAKAKVPLPRSKKPLEVGSAGTWDKDGWNQIYKELGPAARVGDVVQVTKVDVEKDRIVLEINNGMKREKGSWKDHVSVGMGGATAPISQRSNVNAPNGTSIALVFPESIGELTAKDVKKLLAPVLDFEKQSATEQYADTIPPEIKKAIEAKKPVEGMDREQVLLALGPPNHKSRETKDGVDYEDWVYGIPPGRVTFVTFSGPKVVKIKDSYAGLGGSIADHKEP
jgi:hypothetical protein